MKFYIKTKLSENMSETPEGYLLCLNVPLTHTGKLTYVKGEHPFSEEINTLTVTRSIEDLELAIPTFPGKSITIEHPAEFVTPDTWQDLTHGTVINVRRSLDKIEVDGNMEDAILGDFLITTKDAIKAVKQGLREVSLGYDALWEHTGNNSAVHKKIVGNHIALVNTGRAGANFSIKDSGEQMKLEQIQAKFKKMFGKTLDEAFAEKEKDEPVVDAVAEIEGQIKDLQGKLEEAKKAKDAPPPAVDPAAPAPDAGGDKLDKIISLLEKLCGADADSVVDADETEVVEDEFPDKDKEEKEKAKDSVEHDEATKSHAEILAPGIAMTADVKTKALEVAYKTKDGKKIIDALTAGKKLSEVKNHDVIFSAAAEVLKSKRTEDFGKHASVASAVDAFPSLKTVGTMTAEEINKKNEEIYKTK